MIKLLALLLFFTASICYGNPNSNQSRAHRPWNNLLENPGAEYGRAKWGASTSAHLTVTTTAAQVASGSRALAYDAAADNDQMFSQTIAVPNALKGRNCLGKILYINGDANVEFQVTDGTNTIASETLSTVSTHTPSYLSFICPSSGNIRLEIEATADAAPIQIDGAYLGESYLVSQVSQAQLAGQAYFDSSGGNCVWSRTNTAIGAFTADTDCLSPTIVHEFVGDWQTTDADLPQITINDLPPGRYEVSATFILTNGSGGARTAVTISDGASVSGTAASDMSSAEGPAATVIGVFEYTASGDRTFALHGSASSGSVSIKNDGNNQDLYFTVKKFPSSNEVVYTPETTGWYVDANISGANVDLGTSNQSSYIPMADSGLTLTNNGNGITAQIACQNGEASSGTTCTGDEHIGIAYNQPKAGRVRACASFTHRISLPVSTPLFVAFQVAETANSSISIVTDGNTRVVSGDGTGTTETSSVASSHQVCGDFNFTSAGQKTLRLMYEQSVSGTPSTNDIQADANAAIGQRDVHWTVYPISEHVPQPLIVNHVSTDNSAGAKVDAAEFTCSGSSTIDIQSGSFVASIGNYSSGACALTFKSNYYASEPVCVIGPITNTNQSQSITSKSASSMTVDCTVSTTAAACSTGWQGSVYCYGQK